MDTVYHEPMIIVSTIPLTKMLFYGSFEEMFLTPNQEMIKYIIVVPNPNPLAGSPPGKFHTLASALRAELEERSLQYEVEVVESRELDARLGDIDLSSFAIIADRPHMFKRLFNRGLGFAVLIAKSEVEARETSSTEKLLIVVNNRVGKVAKPVVDALEGQNKE